LFLAVFIGGLIIIVRQSDPSFASVDVIEEQIGASSGAGVMIPITIRSNGVAVVNGLPTTKIFRPLSGIDEFRYKVFDHPQTVIDQVTIRVTFPYPLPEEAKIVSYAVHGVDQYTETRIDEKTVEYAAVGIGPDATYTIVATLPAGQIDWPIDRQIAGQLISWSPQTWLSIGVAMPILALAVLLFMYWPGIRALLKVNKNDMLVQPPSQLSPAIVGILINGRISAREIAAALVDLANRGYLSVFRRGDDNFSFAKRNPWNGLQSFELQLLQQLLAQVAFKSTGQDIESTIGANLFSAPIAKIYLSMYDAASHYGYFVKNPAEIHRRYRFIGLLLFFTGLLAFIAVLLLEIQPSYILFLLTGMMGVALIIIFLSDQVPLLTPQGEQARRQWLAFRNYIADRDLISYTEGAKDYYRSFLPYAIVFKEEIEWANRFREHPFAVPDWYDSSEDAIAIEDFANGLHPIVGTIAELFSAAKEPTVH
jgi:hypothetical protein